MMVVLETSYSALDTSSRLSLVNIPIGFYLGAFGTLSSYGGGSEPIGISVYTGTSGAISVVSG